MCLSLILTPIICGFLPLTLVIFLGLTPILAFKPSDPDPDPLPSPKLVFNPNPDPDQDSIPSSWSNYHFLTVSLSAHLPLSLTAHSPRETDPTLHHRPHPTLAGSAATGAGVHGPHLPSGLQGDTDPNSV